MQNANIAKGQITQNLTISNIIKVFAKFSNPLFKYKILKYND